ncbi:MAG TPA: hypothetical protein VFF17_10665, partial [Thermoanaerobaculia bacterium]|nr:hypothetical protein [Thermoanaerobaculia bacterium]
MNPRSARFSVAVAALAFLVGVASASETKRTGGSGGDRTVTMDCGSNAFIVGVSAKGGKDSLIGMNLVRSVQFKCRPFDGATPGDTTSKTATARGTSSAVMEIREAATDCPKDMVVTELDLYAGWYIDKFEGFECQNSALGSKNVHMSVGGSTGTRSGFQCPAGEGLYRVDARVGGTIDSLKGYCRKFGAGVENKWAHMQMDASLRPKVSREAPVKIAPGRSRTFTFTVPESGTGGSKFLVHVAGETDLLGGGVVNLPDYKVEILNPSGNVVKTQTVTGTTLMQSIQMTFAAAGGWKVRVTNRKKDYGALDLNKLDFSPESAPVRRTW